MPDQALGDGRYLLGQLLGSGGSASVYLATDTRLGVQRAIKLIRMEGENIEALRSRLRREALAMARLDHPHVLKIYDVGQHEGGDFVVMELAHGSLADRLSSRGPLPLAEVVRYGVQVLSALEVAHRAGIIHRDVKPANVLLDARGDALLADFGIALVGGDAANRQTRTDVAIGSMAFMAPEQRIDARSVGPAADLYAVGCTLYNLATAATPMDLFLADPESPRWNPVPPALVPVLREAVAVHARDRLSSPRAMAEALSALVPYGDELMRAFQAPPAPPPVRAAPADGTLAEPEGTLAEHGSRPERAIVGGLALAGPTLPEHTLAEENAPASLVLTQADPLPAPRAAPAPALGPRIAPWAGLAAIVGLVLLIWIWTRPAPLTDPTPPETPPTPAVADAAPTPAPDPPAPSVVATPTAPVAAHPAPAKRATPPRGVQAPASERSSSSPLKDHPASGAWNGTMNAYEAWLMLDIDASGAATGRLTVAGRGSRRVSNDLSGTWNSHTASLDLLDTDEAIPDRCRYALSLSEDGQQLSGTCTRVNNSGVVRLTFRRDR